MSFVDLRSNVISSHSESVMSQDDGGEGWNFYQRDQSLTAIKDTPEVKRHRRKFSKPSGQAQLFTAQTVRKEHRGL